MKYKIEIGNADNVRRDDEAYPSEDWESVASGETYEEVLRYFLINANSEWFDIANSWLRLVITNGEKVTVENF
jgi:hypothetical protein